MNFLGAPYPIVKTPQGFLKTQSGINQIKSDLLALLLTYPGERVFLPTFGTPLRDLIFDQNDSETVERARQMIINSIATWEPRVVIDSIDITSNFNQSDLNQNDTGDELPHILGIKILFFDPDNIKDIQELMLEVPLGGTA